MSNIFDTLEKLHCTKTSYVQFKHGLTGNLYVISKDSWPLEEICHKIDKSPSSVYFNKKYNCWAIRIKSKIHKDAIRSLSPLMTDCLKNLPPEGPES